MAEVEREKEGQAPEKEKELAKTRDLSGVLSPIAPEGGYDFLERIFPSFSSSEGIKHVGADKLNPKSVAKRRLFRQEARYQNQRAELRSRLSLIRDLIAEKESVDELRNVMESRLSAIQENIRNNVSKVLEEIRDTERAYRMAAFFFRNAEGIAGEELRGIYFMSPDSIDKLNDPDDDSFRTKIAQTLRDTYDRLRLTQNYSLMFIPGYLDPLYTDKLAQEACNFKVQFFTDLPDLESPKEVIDFLNDPDVSLPDSKEHKAYASVVCNYVLARPGYNQYGEDPLYIPASPALVGRIYNNPVQQVTAGFKHGNLKEVQGTRFEIGQVELGEVVQQSAIPVTFEDGKALSFGHVTLYNGTDPGLRVYSVVRTYDYIHKTMRDYLNRRTFENITPKMLGSVKKAVSDFLKMNMGDKKLIKTYDINEIRIEKSEEGVPEVVRVGITITPWFPAKRFDIALTGGYDDDAGQVTFE